MLENEYDGLFDTTYHKNKLLEELRPIYEEIVDKGLNIRNATIATEAFPEFSEVVNIKKLTHNHSTAYQDVAIEFLQSLSSLLPFVSVKEEAGVITVSGVPTSVLTNVIYKEWNTNRITNNMFVKLGARYFQFYSFFAVEIKYMLEKMLESKSLPYRYKGSVKSIIEGIYKNTWLASSLDNRVRDVKWENIKRLNITPLDTQKDFLANYPNHVARTNLNGQMLFADAGTGKSLVNDTLVKTLTGWTPIGKLKVGDVIIGGDGKPTNVMAVYPHADLKMYKMVLADGRTVKCCEDHLWSVYDHANKEWLVLPTKNIVCRMGKGEEFSLPNVSPLDLPYNEGIETFDDKTQTIPHTYLESSILQRYAMVERLLKPDWLNKINTDEPIYINFNKSNVVFVTNLLRSLGYSILNLANKVYLRGIVGSNTKINDFLDIPNSPGTCITVDNEDRLFVIEDYIVTHNTLTGYMWHMVNEFDTLIVICPKNAVVKVWEDTIKANFVKQPHYFHSLQGGEPTGNEEIIISHYEFMPKILKCLNKVKTKRVGIWLDESHNLNEVGTLRSDTFNTICKESNAEGVVWASGTPLKAIGKETVPLFRSIDPLFTDKVEEQFIKIFGASKGFALDVLNHRMAQSFFRIEKGTVVNNEVNEYVNHIEIPNAEQFTLPAVSKDIKDFVTERMLHYKSIMKEIENTFESIIQRFSHDLGLKDDANFNKYLRYTLSMHRSFDQKRDKDLVVWCKQYEKSTILPNLSNEDKKTFRKVASVYKYVILTVRGEALGRILTRRRIDCFKAMVEHTPFEAIINGARKKTLIFTSYVEVVDAIADEVSKYKFKPIKVYGETNNDLPNMLKQFKASKDANPMVATYNSLSTAVPVIEASTCLLFNSPFRQYIREQATSRVNRLGQDGPVDIISIVLDTKGAKNLSTRSLDIQKWSKEMVDAIMGLDSDESENDTSSNEMYGLM